MRIGIVEDNYDPKEEGRLKIRIYGLTDEKKDDHYVIPTQYLPWAVPGCVNGSGAFSLPKIGTEVYVTGELLYNPIWMGMVHIGSGQTSEVGGDTNAHVLIYDEDFSNGEKENYREGEHIKMYFSENSGLVVDYANHGGTSAFNLNPDGSIAITNANGDSITMNNGTITISSDNVINITAPRINIGEEALNGIIKGDAFRKVFEAHTHIVGNDETLPPKSGMNPNLVSQKIKI